MQIRFDAKSIEMKPSNHNYIDVTVEVSDESIILEEINISAAIDHYGSDDLLDTIGQDAAKKYFDLIDNPEE